MEDKFLFNALEDQIELFFQKYNLDYDLKEQHIEINEKIKGHNYKTYNQVWSNTLSILEVHFDITFYLDLDSKSLINIYIYKYIKTDILEFEKSMNVGDYMKNNKHTPILRLEEYSGVTIDEKISSFFTWFEKNIDKKLVSVLNGNNWIDTPFDWGRYK